MATRIEPFAVTVTAGTAIAAYQVDSLPFNDGAVHRVEIVVPPGPSGLVGFKVAHSNQSVIPYNRDVWIITDDEKLDWTLDGFPTGNSWELWSYNTDVFDHTIYLRFHVTDFAATVAPTIPLLPIPIIGTGEDVQQVPASQL